MQLSVTCQTGHTSSVKTLHAAHDTSACLLAAIGLTHQPRNAPEIACRVLNVLALKVSLYCVMWVVQHTWHSLRASTTGPNPAEGTVEWLL